MQLSLGIVEQIYICEEKRGTPMRVASVQLEAGTGIVGDRYHLLSHRLLAAGKEVPDRHLTLVDAKELDSFLQNHETNLDYGDFRRNIVTRGMNLNGLVGKRFALGSAICYGIELCEPCATLAAMAHEAVLPELVHRAGLRAVILGSGSLETGGSIAEFRDPGETRPQ